MPVFGAVITSYHPASSLLELVETLKSQVSSVVVVDNTESGFPFKEQLEMGPNVHLIENEKNMGVPAALNRGISFQLELAVDWVVILDQDSLVDADYVGKASTSISDFGLESAAVLAPMYLDPVSGAAHRHNKKVVPEAPFEIVSSMASGCIIRAPVFYAVGRLKDEYFIDLFDHEFCFRCREQGLGIWAVPELELVHRLGSAKPERFLNSIVYPTNHEPLRRYFMAKNRVDLYRRYWKSHSRWILSDMKYCAKDVVKILLYEDKRREKIASLVRGIIDGLFNSLRALPVHSLLVIS